MSRADRHQQARAVRAGKSFPMPTWTLPQAGKSTPVQNGLEFHRVGKCPMSIKKMLLREHQVTGQGGLQFSSCV